MKGKPLTLKEAAEKDRGLAFGYKILKGKRVAIYRRDADGVVTYTVHGLGQVLAFIKARFMFDPSERRVGTEVELLPSGRLRVKDGPGTPRVGRPMVGAEPMTAAERMRRMRDRRRAEGGGKVRSLTPMQDRKNER